MEKSRREIPNTTLKVVILGDLGVGKTCLRSQFVHHIFTNAYKATIGGDYLTTVVTVPEIKHAQEAETIEYEQPSNNKPQDSSSHSPKFQLVNLQIWDTAGQERFNSISQAFYRGTDVAVFVYDITNYESVLSIRDWFTRFMEHCHVDRPGIMVVGNKIDRENDRCVDLEEIREILTANSPEMNLNDFVGNWEEDLKEVSCKRLELVEKVFVRVTQIGLNLMNQSSASNSNTETLRRRKVVGFDRIDLNVPHNNSATSSSKCAC